MSNHPEKTKERILAGPAPRDIESTHFMTMWENYADRVQQESGDRLAVDINGHRQVFRRQHDGLVDIEDIEHARHLFAAHETTEGSGRLFVTLSHEDARFYDFDLSAHDVEVDQHEHEKNPGARGHHMRTVEKKTGRDDENDLKRFFDDLVADLNKDAAGATSSCWDTAPANSMPPRRSPSTGRRTPTCCTRTLSWWVISTSAPRASRSWRRRPRSSWAAEAGAQRGGSRHAQAAVERQARATVRATPRRLEQRGRSEDTAEEIAARTVNKERAQAGEAKEASATSTQDKSASKRAGPTLARGPQGRTRDELYADAKRLGIDGRSTMDKDELERAVHRVERRD